jgi:hypothetical protein
MAAALVRPTRQLLGAHVPPSTYARYGEWILPHRYSLSLSLSHGVLQKIRGRGGKGGKGGLSHKI